MISAVYKRVLLLVIVLSAFLFIPKIASASTFTLSPASGNIPQGGTLNVSVRLNTSGEAINAVSAHLSYPQNLLDVTSVTNGSAFGTVAEKTSGGGVIKISLATLNAATGEVKPVNGSNVVVATVGFRAKTNTGSANVSFIGGSAAARASDSSDSLNLGSSRGGTYTLAQASAIQAQVNTLKITDLLPSDITTSSATISWKTDKNANSYIEYGIEKDQYILNFTDTKLVTNHTIKLNNPILIPGLNIHYRVKSKDVAGNEVVSEPQQFQLIGYKVIIKVTDESNQPQEGMDVLLYSYPLSAKTNSSGEAVFDNVTPGTHLAVVKKDGGEQTQQVIVAETQDVQSFEFKISPQKDVSNLISGNQNALYYVIGAALAILVIVVVVIVISNKKSSRDITGPTI